MESRIHQNHSVLLTAVLCVTIAYSSVDLVADEKQPPIRLGIVGMVHGHLNGFLHRKQYEQDFEIVGLCDSNRQLHEKYRQLYNFDAALFYTDLETMLEKTELEAVVAFSTTFDHKQVVETCADHGVHVMMEKPLAVSFEHARAIRAAAERSGIHILVNYETSWHANNHYAFQQAVEKRSLGQLRKIIVRDGHRGPKEIGCPEEFLEWLTDPELNGGGALYDFGCYGANLITWLMDNQRPTSVTAVTQQHKPDIYPEVDDEATIILAYPGMQGIIQASWNWHFGRKDMDVYGTEGYLVGNYRSLTLHTEGDERQQVKAPPLQSPHRNSMDYLAAVLRGKVKSGGLSSLENAMIVSEILDAARHSANSGTTVFLGTREN